MLAFRDFFCSSSKIWFFSTSFSWSFGFFLLNIFLLVLIYIYCCSCACVFVKQLEQTYRISYSPIIMRWHVASISYLISTVNFTHTHTPHEAYLSDRISPFSTFFAQLLQASERNSSVSILQFESSQKSCQISSLWMSNVLCTLQFCVWTKVAKTDLFDWSHYESCVSSEIFVFIPHDCAPWME